MPKLKNQNAPKRSKTRSIPAFRAPGRDTGWGNATVFQMEATGPMAEGGPPILSMENIANILTYSLGGLLPREEFSLRTTISDHSYVTVPPEWVRNSILTDPIVADDSHYVDDIFDCDDYVQYLKVKMSLYAAAKKFPAPIAVGYLMTYLHAFSFCIAPDSSLVLINTQSAAKAITGDRAAFPSFLSLDAVNNRITTIYI